MGLKYPQNNKDMSLQWPLKPAIIWLLTEYENKIPRTNQKR